MAARPSISLDTSMLSDTITMDSTVTPKPRSQSATRLTAAEPCSNSRHCSRSRSPVGEKHNQTLTKDESKFSLTKAKTFCKRRSPKRDTSDSEESAGEWDGPSINELNESIKCIEVQKGDLDQARAELHVLTMENHKIMYDLCHAETNVAKYELILDMKETELQQKAMQIENLHKELQTLKETLQITNSAP